MSLDVSLYTVEECPNCGHRVGTRHLIYDANITHNLGEMAAEAGLYEALWRPAEMLAPDVAKVMRDSEAAKGYPHEDTKRLRDEVEATRVHASDLIGPLRLGLARLKDQPAKYSALNPSNGWGTYVGFVAFVEKYLAACEANPTAEVRADR